MKLRYHWFNHLFNFIGVILGVYLAFYVDEKAEENRDRKESLVLMRSLVNDLSADIETYEEYQIPVNIQHQENLDTLLELFVKNDLERANASLPTILQLENYTPTTSTFNSMKASGKISLIDDLTLQKKLTYHYEGLAEESIAKGELQVNFFTDELLIWLSNHADLMNMKIIDEEEIPILINKLIIYSSLVNQKVDNYEMVLEESKQLRQHLDSLLEAEQ